MIIEKILFFIWPPLELRKVNTKIEEDFEKIDFDKIYSQIKSRLDKNSPNSNEIQEYLQKVVQSEEKRKDSLEAKALQYFSTFSITTTIFSFFPIIITTEKFIPKYLVIILCSIYLFTMLNFIVAIFESIKARKVTQYYLPNIDEVIKSDGLMPFHMDLTLAIKAKANEHILLKKANYISVSENMFSRGLYSFLLVIFVLVIIA